MQDETQLKDQFTSKQIDIKALTHNQRGLLQGGIKNAFMEHKAFNLLGSQHKIIFYDICNMMLKPESLAMLNVSGEEYWKSVEIEIDGKKKKEKQKYIRFQFDYVVPGTSNKLGVIKEWKHEDFTT